MFEVLVRHRIYFQFDFHCSDMMARKRAGSSPKANASVYFAASDSGCVLCSTVKSRSYWKKSISGTLDKKCDDWFVSTYTKPHQRTEN